MAVVLAFVFSAFTEKSTQLTRFYFDGSWQETTLPTCAEGEEENCIVMINNVPRQIYKSKNFADPLKYNP